MTDIRFDDRSGGRSSGAGQRPGSLSETDTCDAEAPSAPKDVLATVARAIQREVVPRLLVATRGRADERGGTHVAVAVSAADIEEFTQLVMAHDRRAASAFVEVLRDKGLPVSDVLLDLLAPAARLLGDLWMRDRCSFADVSLGLVRLQQIMRDITTPVRRTDHGDGRSRHALLFHFPREQHRFGLTLVQEMFLSSGWQVTTVAPASVEEATEVVRDAWFDVLGVSLGNDDLLNDLTSAISTWRRWSRNQALAVLVGGAAFLDHPERSGEVGADASAPNAKEAVKIAEDLVGVGMRTPRGN